MKNKMKLVQDVPDCLVVKNSPSNAGEAGSVSGWGTKTPHAMGQLGPSGANPGRRCSGACSPQLERSPLATAKIPHAATESFPLAVLGSCLAPPLPQPSCRNSPRLPPSYLALPEILLSPPPQCPIPGPSLMHR